MNLRANAVRVGGSAIAILGIAALPTEVTAASGRADSVWFVGHTTTLNCGDGGTFTTAPPWPAVTFPGITPDGTPLDGTPVDNALQCPDAGAAYLANFGGTGAYRFTTTGAGNIAGLTPVPGVCEEASSDAMEAGGTEAPHVGACTVNSAGDYWNLVCGTGLAAGTATVTGLADASNDDDFTISYDIIVVNGVGEVIRCRHRERRR